MAYRRIELTLISARDLKNLNLFSSMQVYAVASVSGDTPPARHRTTMDLSGGRNPTWNTTLHFPIPAAAAAAGSHLHVLLRTARPRGDRDVGEVRVPLLDLLAAAGDGPHFVSYQVRKVGSTKPRGVLNFSYKLGPMESPKPAYGGPVRPDKPVLSYRAGLGSVPAYGHPGYPPPPPSGYGYAAVPPPAYVYAPGYAAPAA